MSDAIKPGQNTPAHNPKVLAINDLAGYSHTSLMAVIPILNTLGIGVTALPTAVLSSNTEWEGFKLVDLNDRLQEFLLHWQSLDLRFDAIYSGFLSSEQQVETVLAAIGMFVKDSSLVVVDPVMADDGSLYPCFSPLIVDSMRRLITQADLITPNLTEAVLLLGEDYADTFTAGQVEQFCYALSGLGPQYVVITNVKTPDLPDKTSVYAFDRTSGQSYRATCDYLPVNYPGTGDIFTSVLCGLMLGGKSLFSAIDDAVKFVSKAMELTMKQALPQREGICLELALSFLHPDPNKL